MNSNDGFGVLTHGDQSYDYLRDITSTSCRFVQEENHKPHEIDHWYVLDWLWSNVADVAEQQYVSVWLPRCCGT